MRSLDGIEIGWAAQIACLFEVNADKPGNVSRHADFHDTRFEDFVASAVAIGPAFQDAARATVGETVLRAVRDTRRFVRTNTNLGIVLLLAPLAKAACGEGSEGLRPKVARVLGELTADDSGKVYTAIRLAAPAGLGEVEQYDVNEGTVDTTLRYAMELAQDRDSVAREYVSDFEITFGLGYETLRRAWEEGRDFSDAIVHAFLTVLAQVPDTLIARKGGRAAAEAVSRRAGDVLAAGGSLSPRGREELVRFDRDLRDDSHRLNPGTTADLVAASIFVFLTEGGMLKGVSDLITRR
ncbi:MAG: triphosphoribosyl-dephospho-CoA synthase [Actinobacteria bacterium]|nr:triphosphoribosyl-dephospho-CoA synthase [Actinomycetota bacterium]